MNLSPVLRQRFYDSNGLPLSGGLLYSYSAGTVTPLTTYSNSTGTTNTNPVVLDSSGYADVLLDPTLSYKFVLKDSGGSTIFTTDNVSAFQSGITNWSANTTYAQGSLVADSSGSGLLYVSLIGSNTGQALTNVSAWRVFAGNVRTLTVNTTLVVTDDLIRSNSTSGSLTHTLPTAGSTPIGKRITVSDIGSGTNTTTCNSVVLISGMAATFHNNGASWDNVAVYGALNGSSVRTVSANTTLLVTDDVVRSNSTAANRTHTLPAAASTPVGKKIVVLDIGSGGFTTTCNSVTIPTGNAVTFQNNGTTWDGVAGYGIVPNASITAAKLASGIVAGAIPSTWTNVITSATTLTANANQLIVGILISPAGATTDYGVAGTSAVSTLPALGNTFFIIPPGQAVSFTSAGNYTLRYVTLANN